MRIPPDGPVSAFGINTVLAHHDGIDRQRLLFAMNRQLKPLRQQRLQHLRNIFLLRAFGELGGNVEAFGIHPVRAGDLVTLDGVRPFHQIFQAHKRVIDPPRISPHRNLESPGRLRRGRLDRRYLKRQRARGETDRRRNRQQAHSHKASYHD
jgi:hypothetical protein